MRLHRPVLGGIREARPRDLPGVEALLGSFNLAIAGVAQHLPGFLVLEDVGRIVASAGLELYGTAALLRSVAVAEGYRNRGLAVAMVNRLVDRARTEGVRTIYLLTMTAQQYFQRLGFEMVPREAVDEAVTASAEFGDSCCATAVAMRRSLGRGP